MKGVQLPLIGDDARARAESAFLGFIGNAEAVGTIKRSLTIALARQPHSLDKTFLLLGPPSTGKTEIARRIIEALGIPFVRIDGRMIKTRERLFGMIDEALDAHDAKKTRDGPRSGIPVQVYPPFGLFVDEVHLAGGRALEGFLTMLENDDRSVVIDGVDRHVANVRNATFVFATTKPTLLDRAFRSRCMDVRLQRYSLDEVSQMVRARFADLDDDTIEKVAGCSRLTPRRAFDLAREVRDEITVRRGTAKRVDVASCVRDVMRGAGIVFANGTTRNDLAYMQLLENAKGRPMGERAIAASLHAIPREEIGDDIEPFLIDKEYIAITARGREITWKGRQFMDQVKGIPA
jgi:Holliday junction resolvasome RuvABC ATP-dependent DNA helicase subunit